MSLYHHPWITTGCVVVTAIMVNVQHTLRGLSKERHMILEPFLDVFEIIFLRRKIGKGDTSLRNDTYNVAVAAGLSAMHTVHIHHIHLWMF